MYSICKIRGMFSHAWLFLYLRHARIEPSNNNELCGKNHFIFSVFAYKYYQLKKKNKRELGKAAQELSGLVGTVNLSQRSFLLKWAMNIDNKYPRFINVLCKFPLVEHNHHFKQSYCLHLRDLNSRWMHLIFTHNW